MCMSAASMSRTGSCTDGSVTGMLALLRAAHPSAVQTQK